MVSLAFMQAVPCFEARIPCFQIQYRLPSGILLSSPPFSYITLLPFSAGILPSSLGSRYVIPCFRVWHCLCAALIPRLHHIFCVQEGCPHPFHSGIQAYCPLASGFVAPCLQACYLPGRLLCVADVLIYQGYVPRFNSPRIRSTVRGGGYTPFFTTIFRPLSCFWELEHAFEHPRRVNLCKQALLAYHSVANNSTALLTELYRQTERYKNGSNGWMPVALSHRKMKPKKVTQKVI